MLETHVKILATIYTALLMAAVSYVLIFAGFEIKSPVVKGKLIQATMVDISQLKPRSKTKEVKKQPPPKKEEPKKQEPKKQEPKKKDPPKKEPIKKDPPKKDPPKKDPPRIVKKTPVVDTKAQELERKKDQERKKKQEALKKKRIEAEKRAKQAEQELNDLINKVKDKEVETSDAGNTRGPSDADKKLRLMTQYQLAVIATVERQWNKPVSANNNLLCHVKVRQIPGGGVVDATISSPCNANSIVKKSIIAAIKKADPLPYKGFESVFSRSATFIFKPTND